MRAMETPMVESLRARGTLAGAGFVVFGVSSRNLKITAWRRVNLCRRAAVGAKRGRRAERRREYSRFGSYDANENRSRNPTPRRAS